MTSSSDSGPLAGKVALVTGGASGIGAATVVALAEQGATVAVLDRDAEGAARSAEAAREIAGAAEAVVVELGDGDAIGPAVRGVIEALGRIDILVNCAAIVGEHGTVLDLSERSWDEVHAVNLTAPFLLMQQVARHMVERGGGGRIVNVSSSSAFRAGKARLAYASSKAALVQLTRSAAAELAPHEINVNAVAPGITASGMTRGRDLGGAVRAGPLVNLFERPSEPEDVAPTIVFLCLPESRQITAQTIHTSAGNVV